MHEVSEDWLRARKQVLTATDIVKLKPEYKKWLRKPGEWLPGFSALWCEKHSDMPIDTGSPSNSAARGHVMEPYAVEAWNKASVGKRMFHWDDCIVLDKQKLLGFSPDALDVRQPDGTVSISTEKMSKLKPTAALEVKCYEPAHHMKSVIAPKMGHEEITQVAVAFAVLPTLEECDILWYCPASPIPTHREHYTRADLEDEIKTVVGIGDTYALHCFQYDRIAKKPVEVDPVFTEDQIYLEHVTSLQGGEFMIGG